MNAYASTWATLKHEGGWAAKLKKKGIHFTSLTIGMGRGPISLLIKL
jgi:hypothetical protein